jgi:BarA-like signal transduction histidine kinase
MKVIAKPVLRTYEVLLTEDDLRNAVGQILGSSTLQVTHVDRVPHGPDRHYQVRICIAEVPEA